MASYIVNGVSQNLFDLYSGDTLQAISGGVANTVRVSAGGIAYVSAGGTGTNVEVFQGGQLSLGPGGGQLDLTVISSGGKLYMNGGNASRTNLGSSGSMFLNDGSALSATVAGSKSYLEVNGGILRSGIVGGAAATNSTWRPLIKVSGGFINDTEVRSGGTVWMTEGTASSAYIREGGLWSMDGGRMSSATLYLGGSLTLANASVKSVYISGDAGTSKGGTVTVANGGKLTNASANFGGTVRVRSGGSASDVLLSYGGILEVHGGRAENVSAISFNGGTVDVKEGGIVSNILFSNTFNGHNGAVLNVSTGGSASSGKIIEQANVYFGGKVTELNIYSAGVLTLYGGTATSTNVMIDGHLNVSGGIALDTRVSPLVNGIASSMEGIYGKPAYMDVLAGGSASNTTVSKGGSLTVKGVATDTTVSSGGRATVLSSGVARNFDVAWNGEASVRIGGIISGGIVSGGGLYVEEGGTAENVEVRGGNGGVGKLIVGNAGFVTGITAGAAGSLSILDGATAVNILASIGTVHVSNGGWLSHTELNNATLYVNFGGISLNTLVHENGSLRVEQGGVLLSATVDPGGSCLVSSGGGVGSMTVASGGTAVLRSGSILTAPIAADGGTIVLDLASLDAPNAGPLVTNFSMITGTPTGTPHLQALVTPDQAAGAYVLGTDAAGFSNSVTVTAAGQAAVELAALSPGQSLKYNDQYYTLGLFGNNLLMTVSAPAATRLTMAGEFATQHLGDELAVYSDGSIRLQSFTGKVGNVVGALDPNRWEILGSLDFDADGLDELAVRDGLSGNVFLADDPGGGIWDDKLTGGPCPGLLGTGYSFYGGGSFDGKSGTNDILMKGPAFGDPTLSLNYGLPVWVFDNGVKQYDGWLGALVNTWQSGDPLRGDTSNPVDINAKNYQYDLVGIGDFNGDGRTDVMLQNTMPSTVAGKTITGAGDVFVFLTGDESAVQAGAAPTVCYSGKVDAVDLGGWCVAGIGDFDNDNIDDVLLLNQANGQTACWIMNNGQMQAAYGLNVLAAGEHISGVWDVNGDGTDDIIVADPNRYTCWTISNGQYAGTQLLA
ncbi:MAG: hypothetical protein IJT50_05765 [Lentisphaeria bacterium]|nr:hypothetical protein [Lentisphaeria bacterium]